MEKKKYESPEMEVLMMKMQNHVLLITSDEAGSGGEGDPDAPLD